VNEVFLMIINCFFVQILQKYVKNLREIFFSDNFNIELSLHGYLNKLGGTYG
jgi:hypothetical protein